MRFEDEELEFMDKVNHLMEDIHDHSNDIFEALMDERKADVVTQCQSLPQILRKLIKTYKSPTTTPTP